MNQKPRLKLLIVYDAGRNEYSISNHNLEPQMATEFIEEWQPQLKEGSKFMTLDQKRRHKSSDAQNCRACREQVRHSSGLEPQPTFKRGDQ